VTPCPTYFSLVLSDQDLCLLKYIFNFTASLTRLFLLSSPSSPSSLSSSTHLTIRPSNLVSSLLSFPSTPSLLLFSLLPSFSFSSYPYLLFLSPLSLFLSPLSLSSFSLSLSSPLRCVVIEDSIVGLKAAKGAGMRYVLYTGTVPTLFYTIIHCTALHYNVL
jgi:hypothetical protein